MSTLTQKMHFISLLHHTQRKIKIKSASSLVVISQVVALGIFAFVCNRLALFLHLPVPGSVLGMGLLFLLLILEWIPEHMLRVGAAWLIGDLLLFFIPPVISVIKYQGLLEHYGLKLLLTLVIGTALVLVSTGFVVDRVFKFEQTINEKRQQKQNASVN